ncbi:MAG: metallophosphoesterase family protein [Bacteroides sp.]|nr:metallophosphoesterase family protein [Bacteroides sp.]MBD5271320.1 metallophosphoesterase family protein [Bacteroides sp.]MBD5332660.1 metallophosphoesterase family protein [Bacteroides sp.]
MKLIGILSDTHSYWDDRYATHFEGCDEIWHAGDIGDYSIIERLQEIAPVVRAVRGNIDSGTVARKCPEVLSFDIEGLRVMLRHIGGYPGRYAPGVEKAMREDRTGLMVCGHSHILKVMPDVRLGLLHINPGAAGQSGWQQVRTLIKLTVDSSIPKGLEVIELGKRGR